MPKGSHRMAARQAELARRKKKQQHKAGPAEPASVAPVAPAEGAVAAQPAAAPAGAASAPPTPAAVAPTPAPSPAAAPAPSSPKPAAAPAPTAKVSAAYARFLNEQRYFVKDLVAIGIVTGLIAIVLVVLALTIR